MKNRMIALPKGYKLGALLSATALILAACNPGNPTHPRPGDGADTGNNMVCTQEAKQCPDGSYVGRSGPRCEFAACP